MGWETTLTSVVEKPKHTVRIVYGKVERVVEVSDIGVLREEIISFARACGLSRFNVKIDGRYVTPIEFMSLDINNINTIEIEKLDVAGVDIVIHEDVKKFIESLGLGEAGEKAVMVCIDVIAKLLDNVEPKSTIHVVMDGDTIRAFTYVEIDDVEKAKEFVEQLGKALKDCGATVDIYIAERQKSESQ